MDGIGLALLIALLGFATFDPALIIGERVGVAVGTKVATVLPPPKPRLRPAPAGGQFCLTAAALGWGTTRVAGVTGPDAAINMIGATAEYVRNNCP